MRFMMLIKGDQRSEAGVLPDATLLAAMGRYNEELAKSGVLLSGEGLAPTSAGALVRGGRTIAVTDGPFTEAKEVVAGFWTIQARSLDEAIEWAKRVPFEAGPPSDRPGQVEVRQIFETEDFPVSAEESGWRQEEDAFRAAPPPPVAGKEKYVLIVRANARSEAGELPTEPELAAMGALIEEMVRKGVLLAGEGLQPSAKGARITYEGGKRVVVDGPFVEAKELVGGYSLVQVASKDEALGWAKRHAAAAGADCTIEVRRVYTEADFTAA